MSVKGDWMPLKGRGFRLKTASAPEAAVSTTVEQGRFQRRLSAATIIALTLVRLLGLSLKASQSPAA